MPLFVDSLIEDLLDIKRYPPSKILVASAAEALGDIYNAYIQTYNQWLAVAMAYEKLLKEYEQLKEKFNRLLPMIEELQKRLDANN